MFDPYSGVQIFGKRYDVHNNVAYIAYWQNYNVFTADMRFKVFFIESNIRALVLYNLLNTLRKRDKMLGKPCVLSLFPNSFNNFSKT